MANEASKPYLNRWLVNDTITAIFNPGVNWFYIFDSHNTCYFVGQESNCKAGVFGDLDHFIKNYKN